MLIALNANGVRSLPVLSGERGTCPGCGSPVVAHCGAVKDWHWAHLASDRECDSWYEPEGDWHRGWKATLTGNDPARMEVTIRDPVGGKWHRADAVSSDGWVIELQRSKITAHQMAEREDFYGSHSAGMVWLFEGAVFENPFDTRMGTRDNRLLRAHSPVFVDSSHSPEGGRAIYGLYRKGRLHRWGKWTPEAFANMVVRMGIGPLVAELNAELRRFDLPASPLPPAERARMVDLQRQRGEEAAARRQLSGSRSRNAAVARRSC